MYAVTVSDNQFELIGGSGTANGAMIDLDCANHLRWLED